MLVTYLKKLLKGPIVIKIAGVGRDKPVETPVEILLFELFRSYLIKILPYVDEKSSFFSCLSSFRGGWNMPKFVGISFQKIEERNVLLRTRFQ